MARRRRVAIDLDQAKTDRLEEDEQRSGPQAIARTPAKRPRLTSVKAQRSPLREP